MLGQQARRSEHLYDNSSLDSDTISPSLYHVMYYTLHYGLSNSYTIGINYFLKHLLRKTHPSNTTMFVSP